MKKVIIMLLVAALLTGLGFATYTYFKPHQNIWKAKPVKVIKTEALIAAFEANADEFNATWIDEVIQINGVISSITKQSDSKVVTFDNGLDFVIQAYLNHEQKHETDLVKGDSVKLKGKYVGWILNDEDFMIPADIKIEQCFIIP